MAEDHAKDTPSGPRRVRFRAILAAALPFRILRTLAYRLLLGFGMPLGTRLGWMALVDAREVTFGRRVIIGRRVRITGVGILAAGEGVAIGARTRLIRAGRVSIGSSTTIGGDNVFQAPSWSTPPGDLDIGDEAIVTADHFFDLTESIRIGGRTTIGGLRSTFWTHGGHRPGSHGAISIGEDCYLGSDVKVAPGVALPDRTVVGLGSVVVKGPEDPGSFIAGSPATVRGQA